MSLSIPVLVEFDCLFASLQCEISVVFIVRIEAVVQKNQFMQILRFIEVFKIYTIVEKILV